MATRIIEYGGSDRADRFPIVPTTQQIAVQTAIVADTTNQQSAAFNAATSMVIIQSDEAVYVAFGANPNATTNDYRLQAGTEMPFTVVAAQKVSVKVS